MNITKTVELYVQSRPSLKDILKRGLVNYSALSRTIIIDLELKKQNFDAIVTALRRLYEKFSRENKEESKIMMLLKHSKLEIHNKVVVIITSKGSYWDFIEEIQKRAKRNNDTFQVVEGVNDATIITSEDYLEELRKALRHKIKKINKDLVEVILKSPESLEEVPGVMGFIYSLFSENNINIVETMSCWTDTIFVIDQKDLPVLMKMFNF